MKITTLIENHEDEFKRLKYEHGLSIFIESDHGNILFDTGKSGDFISNAEKLNIDLKSIDTVVLSHAHYDHCGGVKKLLEDYDIKPKFILGDTFFKNKERYHYSDGTLKTDFSKCAGYTYVGIDFEEEYLKEKDIEVKYINKNMYKLNDEIFIFTNFKKRFDFEKMNPDMKIKIKEDSYIVDKFNDEIAIGLKTKDGIVILMGCAHPGFLNMIESIKEFSEQDIIAVIGGTHFVEADDERINKSIKYLNEKNIRMIGLSHCTGEKAMKEVGERCKGAFVNRTGTVLEF